jgi:MATE family multidrug resistance protein
VWQAGWLALCASAVLAVPVILAVPLLEPLGIAPDVAAQARPYLVIRAFGLMPLLLFVGVRAYLQALGRTRAQRRRCGRGGVSPGQCARSLMTRP